MDNTSTFKSAVIISGIGSAAALICTAAEIPIIIFSPVSGFISFTAAVLAVSSGISATAAEFTAFMHLRKRNRCPKSPGKVCAASAVSGSVAALIYLLLALFSRQTNAAPTAALSAISAAIAFVCSLIYRKIRGNDEKSSAYTVTAAMFMLPLIVCALTGMAVNYARLGTDIPGSDTTVTDAEEVTDTFAGLEALKLDGELYSFDTGLSGNKVNIINVWATFCGPCIKEMPDLEEISLEYAGRVGVLGICADTSDTSGQIDYELLDKAERVAHEDIGVTYPVIIPSYELQNGIMGDIFAYPTTYITDSSGTVLESFYGRRTKEQFVEILEKYL